jgi:peptidoglycan hydrolase-like protein with peptidoglycan-binding domain
MIGYIFSDNSTPVKPTTAPTSGNSIAPRTIPSNFPNQALIPPQHNIAPTFADPLVLDLQQELNRKGFNAGVVDGLIGPQTRDAISAAQRSLNMYVDGEPSDTLLKALRRW